MDDSVDKEKALQEFKEKFGLNVNKLVDGLKHNLIYFLIIIR